MKNKLYDANRIYDAGTEAMAGSRFKYKTQLYEMTQLSPPARGRGLKHGGGNCKRKWPSRPLRGGGD